MFIMIFVHKYVYQSVSPQVLVNALKIFMLLQYFSVMSVNLSDLNKIMCMYLNEYAVRIFACAFICMCLIKS